ncbi:MAG: glycosyltransferase family A protein [Chthoniobacteraceae bacterium]|jgi:glycosyltransferase involved in cell wall biosynthesis
MQVSAYIPCYNGAATLKQAIESVRNQSRPVDEFYVIDNGSTDDSAHVAEQAGARVIRLDRCLGRGASRTWAMAEAKHPLVLSCDAGIELPPDFAAKAERWFEDAAVAAVAGRIAQREARTVADRWRARHLFRTEKLTEVIECARFSTGGAMVRAAAVKEVGGYDPGCYYGEDADLGRRLLERNWKVVFDPELTYWQIGSNSAGEALERYWRWNKGARRMDLLSYLKQIKYSATVMAREDMETDDLEAAAISLISPHYQFWRDRMK